MKREGLERNRIQERIGIQERNRIKNQIVEALAQEFEAYGYIGRESHRRDQGTCPAVIWRSLPLPRWREGNSHVRTGEKRIRCGM